MSFATETYTIQGMQQDLSELMADKKFSYENMNIRLLVDDATTNLVITQEKGNKRVDKLYLTRSFFNTDETSNINNIEFEEFTTIPGIVVGECVLDKYLVLFTKTQSTYVQNNITINKNSDVIIRLELLHGKFYGWIIYDGDELNFDTKYPLETLGNVETNLIKKVYFVDGINVPRAVNLVSPNAGQLGNINLGFSLSLQDKFNVEKDTSIIGNYPIGKVRFFYTYFNDNFSETNIVDWSPFFDCNALHQGGGVDSQYKTQFAFKVSVINPDTQFKFVRIYMQHFTSPDPNVYTMKYIERPLYGEDIVFTFSYDQEDAKNATETYVDKRIVNATIIPYTMAEKNNRMFYGNIKQQLPDISDIDFSTMCDVAFYEKQIGYEDLTKDTVYQYDPENTTFAGSNFDYMGFRKDNWYRFGFIAQHRTGSWSNVMFICDKQCNISSKTDIQYDDNATQFTSVVQTNPLKPITESIRRKVPKSSNYYIPSAKLVVKSNNFKKEIQKLKDRGYVRIKPVCVVPPIQYRNVITQGISCPTLYTGGNRNQNTTNGLFSIPSHFFRPQPLYVKKDNIVSSSKTFVVDYAFTLRSLGDLKIKQNIKDSDGEGEWYLNPKFDNEQYTNYNSVFREYRHGFALPPKDRINAELQSSDFAINDYFYKINNQDSKIFAESNGFDLFGFVDSIDDYAWLFKWLHTIDDIKVAISKGYAIPYHRTMTSGYNNTVFIDESICTLNSPEIDYNFSSLVEPVFKNQQIDVVGYAQITNSQTNIDIPNTKFDPKEGGRIAKDIANKISTGKCLFNLIEEPNVNLDDELIDYIRNFKQRRKIQNNPLSIMNGPWWLDTMLVNAFVHTRIDRHLFGSVGSTFTFFLMSVFDVDAINQQMWLALLFASNNAGYLDSATLNYIAMKADYIDGMAQPWDLHNYTTDDTLEAPDVRKDAMMFTRALWVNQKEDSRNFKWTSSYYGETNKSQIKDKWDIVNKDSSIFLWRKDNDKIAPAYFLDFAPLKKSDIDNINLGSTIDAEDLKKYVEFFYRASKLGITWSSLYYDDQRTTSDAFWNQYYNNRSEHNNYVETLPTKSFSSPNYIYSKWSMNNTTDEEYNDNFFNDGRGTFSYYFFPFYKVLTSKNDDYYESTADIEGENNQVVTHPWLLPQNSVADYPTINSIIDKGYKYFELNDTKEFGFFDGSKFGCHYYAPFSTNFIGSVFDPYYAHVVYPFMSNDTDLPFCGSHDAYRLANSRPAYNSTNSNLYSNCTNYIDDTSTHSTVSAYYHAPQITQEYRPEPDLTDIPFFKDTNITRIYSYLCNDAASQEFAPTLAHYTYTLTAAMKWYRGFKRLGKDEGTYATKWVCNGNYINKSSIMGDLLFSGYLPQLFTKNGLLNVCAFTNTNIIDVFATDQKDAEGNYTRLGKRSAEISEMLSNDTVKTLTLNSLSTPHIVYYNYNKDEKDTLMLLDKFVLDNEQIYESIINSCNNFKPEFYYKEFVSHNPPVPIEEDDNVKHSNWYPIYVKTAAYWYRNTYPHTGTWQQYNFAELGKADDKMPYWNRNNRLLKSYPKNPKYKNHVISQSNLDSKFITHDSTGKKRDNNNYWILPISNMYNSNLIDKYNQQADNQDKNPYKFEHVSPEHWNWKICGNSVQISDFTDSLPEVLFLEGDTYFQRYNCFKTISKDTTASLLWNNTDDASQQEYGVNDVTETASIMLESYTNLDGLYWEYNSLTSDTYSPLVHPFYNNMKQINPVYSIQNDLCDTFKQIDQDYENSKLTHYPTKIMWSAQKIEGETQDSWGIIPITNGILVSGEMGAINKLISYNNNVFSLQEHGLSVLNYDPQVVQPTDNASTLSIYLSDSTKLQGVTYVSRTIGTSNKWSVILGKNGFYWMDETLRKIYSYGQQDEAMGVGDMTLQYGMQSWANNNINLNAGIWSATSFVPSISARKDSAFKANVDLKTGDVYWMNNNKCLCFNENVRVFTSFYSYDSVPYKFNYLDEVYSLKQATSSVNSDLYEDQCTYDHTFYGKKCNSYIDLLVNTSGLYDKIFNFIEYAAESYKLDRGKWVLNANFNPYNKIAVRNMYQSAEEMMDKRNTKERFRLWRTDIPRERKLNRIRGPWCHVVLQNKTDELHLSSNTIDENYKDKLYYINVNYTIPEQPLKSNVPSSN